MNITCDGDYVYIIPKSDIDIFNVGRLSTKLTSRLEVEENKVKAIVIQKNELIKYLCKE